jgi:hypothetical protein
MDPIERLQRIAELRAQADAGRERIRQREEAREADPIKMHEHLMGQAHEAQRSPLARETELPDIVYREFAPSASASAPATAPADFSGWEAWLAGHLEIERREMLDIVARGMAEVFEIEKREIRKERDIELIELRREVAVLRGRVNCLIDLLSTKGGGTVLNLPRGFWKGDDVA